MEETIRIEETIRKVSAIFDKMASVKITPTSNYSIPEYWMNRAIKGDEKCKNNLFNWITIVLNIDKSILNAVFNAKYNRTNENKVMNRKLIRLTESDLHRIVKESVHKIINEIGDTEKGQDALGQVHGRAIRRAQNLGNKGAVPRKLRNVARDAKDKAYSQAPNHDIYADSPFDKGISTGYEKATNKFLKETLEPAYPNSNSTDVSEIAGELYERINDCFLRDRGDSDWDFEIEQAAQENPKEIYHLLADLQNFLEMIYNKHINN